MVSTCRFFWEILILDDLAKAIISQRIGSDCMFSQCYASSIPCSTQQNGTPPGERFANVKTAVQGVICNLYTRPVFFGDRFAQSNPIR